MLDRDVGRPLLEVIHRIAARSHDALHQAVRFGDSTLRVVDEQTLRLLPLRDIAVARVGRQRPQIQRVMAPFAVTQLLFAFTTAPGPLHGAVVFGTEALPQRTRTART